MTALADEAAEAGEEAGVGGERDLELVAHGKARTPYGR